MGKVRQSSKKHIYFQNTEILHLGGARGVMAIVVGNGHSDTSSYPGRG